MSEDIRLISTEDLLAEVFSRYDTAVFGGIRRNSKDAKKTIFKLDFTGDAICALGVAAMLQDSIHEYRSDNIEDTNGDE